MVELLGWSCDPESFLTCENDDGNTGFIFGRQKKVNPSVWETLSEEERNEKPYEGYEDWAGDDPAVFCNAPREEVTLDEIREPAQDIWEEKVEFPEFEANPGPTALVQAPVILSADEPDDPVSHEIEQPVPGVLEARPEYVWKIDGTAVAEGSGREYDGTSPKKNPDYYVHHVFESTGEHHLTLEVHWKATVTVGNNEPVELDALVLTETTELDVRESVPHLTDN